MSDSQPLIMPRSAEPIPPGALVRARWIAHLLDDLVRIPGTRRRVGLDPLFGLVPGFGDWLPLLISLDLVVAAWRAGGGAAVLVRMLGHVAIDAIVGMVPLVGDLFDFGWKANRRNLVLLEGVVAEHARTRRESRWIVGGVVASAMALVGAGVWASWWLVAYVVRAVIG